MSDPEKKREPLAPEAFGRLILVLIGVIWLGVGVWSLVQPEAVGATLDLDLSDPEGGDRDLARFEFRAMYGGLALALAAMHLFGALRSRWLIPCHWMAATLLIGLVGGRAVALAAGDVPGFFGFVLLLVELAGLGLALFSVRRIRVMAKAAATAKPLEPVAPEAPEPEDPPPAPEDD